MNLRRHPASNALALSIGACLAFAPPAHAQALASRSDWGDVGLLQTPAARMPDEGEFGFITSHVSPYTHYTISLQPLPWLEGEVRYTNITGVLYGPESFSGNQHYKDKSIDAKVHLWRESRWLPDVAFGIRDIGGTGLFSSEYLVANKRFGAFDASLGLATGYLGNRGDFGNPLGLIDDSYKTRPHDIETGQVSWRDMFKGRVGAFGGVNWQTPWSPLAIKLEYDGNDYKHEPAPRGQQTKIEQSSPVNIGAVFSPNKSLSISLGWERGNELEASLTLHTNLAQAHSSLKLFDPPPLPPQKPAAGDSSNAAAPTRAGMQPDAAAAPLPAIEWHDLSGQLDHHAGLGIQRVAVRGNELILADTPTNFHYPAERIGRAVRLLDATLPPDIQWLTFDEERYGLRIAETSVNRAAAADYLDHRIDRDDLARSLVFSAPEQRYSDPLYQAPRSQYDGHLYMDYKQFLDGPDTFILYQFTLNYSATLRFNRNLWLSGTASNNLVNNFDNYRLDSNSELPHVRTDQRQYAVSSDFQIPNLQLTGTWQYSRDVFGMAYGGLLEPMFDGVGSEVLYRPFGERWALGADANWVKQRGYRQDFALRDYDVVTGHASLYYRFGQQHPMLAKLSAGRYLAGDRGATLDLSRTFSNGVSMGAWVTKTNVSSQLFGEGSFDKGIYFSIPLDLMLPRSSLGSFSTSWRPLTRDGGARLNRVYTLYDMTDDRESAPLYDNLDMFDQ